MSSANGGDFMLTNRQKLILKAIIEQYIKDGQPVGSKTITELPYLNYSSATIRFDMAVLEELRYLDKTHTSSGRVPSEQGIRYYIDNLLTRDRNVVELFPLVDEIFEKNRYSKRKALEKAADLLSAITSYPAIGINPSGYSDYIKKMEFMSLTGNEGVIIIVIGDGTVLSQKITITDNIDIKEVYSLFERFNELFKNKSVAKVRTVLITRYRNKNLRKLENFENTLLEIVIELLSNKSEDQFYLSGMTNMFDDQYFSSFDSLKESIVQLNEKNISSLISSDTGLSIRLGSDILFMPKSNFSIISIPYRFSDSEKGSLAVIGPTRMNYRQVIPLIEYIAVYLSELYEADEEWR